MSFQLVADYDSEEEEKLRKSAFADSEEADSDEEEDSKGNGEGDQPDEEQKEARNQESDPVYVTKPGSKQRGVTGLPMAADLFSKVDGPPQYLTTQVQKESSIPKTAALVAMGSLIEQPSTGVLQGDDQPSLSQRTRMSGNQFSIAGNATGPRRARYEISSGAVLDESAVAERGRSSGTQGQSRGEAGGAEAGGPPRRAEGEAVLPAADAYARAGKGGVPDDAAKRKKDGAVKDKEKLKRMKGQSSHATWKSETEMQLRQTYD